MAKLFSRYSIGSQGVLSETKLMGSEKVGRGCVVNSAVTSMAHILISSPYNTAMAHGY